MTKKIKTKETQKEKRSRLNMMKFSSINGQAKHVLNLIQRSSYLLQKDEVGFDSDGRFFIDCKFRAEDGSTLSISDLVAVADGLYGLDETTETT